MIGIVTQEGIHALLRGRLLHGVPEGWECWLFQWVWRWATSPSSEGPQEAGESKSSSLPICLHPIQGLTLAWETCLCWVLNHGLGPQLSLPSHCRRWELHATRKASNFHTWLSVAHYSHLFGICLANTDHAHQWLSKSIISISNYFLHYICQCFHFDQHTPSCTNRVWTTEPAPCAECCLRPTCLHRWGGRGRVLLWTHLITCFLRALLSQLSQVSLQRLSWGAQCLWGINTCGSEGSKIRLRKGPESNAGPTEPQSRQQGAAQGLGCPVFGRNGLEYVCLASTGCMQLWDPCRLREGNSLWLEASCRPHLHSWTESSFLKGN